MIGIIIASIVGFIAWLGYRGSVYRWETEYRNQPSNKDGDNMKASGNFLKFVFNICLAYIIGYTLIKMGIHF